jgi:type IV secretion system protein VirD4
MELQLLATLFLQSDSDYVKGLLEGGIELFVAAGLLAFQRGRPTLGEIYRIASAGGDKQVAYRACALEVQNEAARLIFMRLASTNQNTLTSYLSLLMTSGLSQWSNPAIDRATEVSDFDFRTIRRKPMSVYLVVAPNMVKPLAALIRLFFSDLIASLQTREPDGTEPWPVMILLDEFNRLGKMPIVVESIETLRSYRGHLAIVTQTIPALDEIYGENTRRALQGNAGVKLYLTPSDEKTVEELSKAVGRTTKRVVTRSRAIGRNPFEGRSLSERTEEVALLPEDEARRMPLDDVVMVVDAQMPVRAKRIQYFADRYFRRIHAAQGGTVPFPRVEVRRGVDEGEGDAPRSPSPGSASPWAQPPLGRGDEMNIERPEVDEPPAVALRPGPPAASGLPADASIEMAKAGDGQGRIRASTRKKTIKQKGVKDVWSRAKHGALSQKDEAIQDLERIGRAQATEAYEASSVRMAALEVDFARGVDRSL